MATTLDLSFICATRAVSAVHFTRDPGRSSFDPALRHATDIGIVNDYLVNAGVIAGFIDLDHELEPSIALCGSAPLPSSPPSSTYRLKFILVIDNPFSPN